MTEEEFERVQDIRKTHRTVIQGQTRGLPPASNIWVKKAKCKCGHAMNRRTTYVSKAGVKKYVFRCYDQKKTDTIKTRLNHGLPIEGICDNKTVLEWKFEVQADFIFRNLLKSKQEIYDKAMEMLSETITAENTSDMLVGRIEKDIAAIDKLKAKIDTLVDMCTDGDISREVYKKKKAETEGKISSLEDDISKARQELQLQEDDNILRDRMEVMSDFFKD